MLSAYNILKKFLYKLTWVNFVNWMNLYDLIKASSSYVTALGFA